MRLAAAGVLLNVVWLLSSDCPGLLAAEREVPLAGKSKLVFATAEEGKAALTHVDEYIERLGPFDRQSRLKKSQAVSQQELLDHFASSVLDWTDGETAKLAGVVDRVHARLEPWKLPLPAKVLLVKTSGAEEANAAYTRGTTIALPKAALGRSADRLEALLLHELFHVLSRANPALRERLYAVVGFHHFPGFTNPPELADRRITNPDAPLDTDYIDVMVDGAMVRAVPILYASERTFDPKKHDDFFDYLRFQLLVVEPKPGAKPNEPWRAARDERGLRLLDPEKVPSFKAQIGRNTNYTIHPEEILADNFVLLMQDKQKVPSPKILDGMRKVLEPPVEASGQ